LLYVHGIEPKLEALANKVPGQERVVWGMFPVTVIETVDIEGTGSTIATGGPVVRL